MRIIIALAMFVATLLIASSSWAYYPSGVPMPPGKPVSVPTPYWIGGTPHWRGSQGPSNGSYQQHRTGGPLYQGIRGVNPPTAIMVPPPSGHRNGVHHRGYGRRHGHHGHHGSRGGAYGHSTGPVIVGGAGVHEVHSVMPQGVAAGLVIKGRPGDPGCFKLPNGNLRCPNHFR